MRSHTTNHCQCCKWYQATLNDSLLKITLPGARQRRVKALLLERKQRRPWGTAEQDERVCTLVGAKTAEVGGVRHTKSSLARRKVVEMMMATGNVHSHCHYPKTRTSRPHAVTWGSKVGGKGKRPEHFRNHGRMSIGNHVIKCSQMKCHYY